MAVEPISFANSGIWQVVHILSSNVIGKSPSRSCGISGGEFSKDLSNLVEAPGVFLGHLVG